MITFKNVELFKTSLERQTFGKEAYNIAKLKSLETDRIEIEISRRCKRVAGNVCVNRKTGEFKVNVSYDYYKEFGIERSIKTLRHELAHVISYKKTGKMDHSNTFKNICVELGGSMAKDMAGYAHKDSACEQYIRGNIKGYKYVYSCPKCDNKIERTRKITDSVKRKICGRCRTKVALWTETYVIL